MPLRGADVIRFSTGSLRGFPSRTVLMLVAMAIGVCAVVVLTSLGEGARRYVVVLTSLGEGARRYVTGEFASLGTNLIIVFPGRSETAGINPTTMMGETPRDLTLDDARSLLRSYSVLRIAPINVGSADVSWKGRSVRPM